MPQIQAIPVDPQPQISWVAITAPAALRYNGTTVQAVHKALVRAFGEFPIRLGRDDHLSVLIGMKAAAGEGATPYEILFEALLKFGELEVRDR
jgi:hypothetical protein